MPSYDDPFIIAGQGTTGLEVAQDCEAQNINHLDALITPIGGGGLCAGISLALGKLSPHTRIFGAEPTDYNDHQMSIRSGERQTLQATPPTLCDAIMTPTPGDLTFPINRKSVEDVFTASDNDCLIAMAIAKKELGVQLEPGGAAAMAALLNGGFDGQDDIKTICVILSGGNVDPDIARRADAMLGA